jgi:ATP-dependent Lon protease
MSNKQIFCDIETMPMLALRGISVFPGMLLNFDVERQMSILALNAALSFGPVIFLCLKKIHHKDAPSENGLYKSRHNMPPETIASNPQRKLRQSHGRGSCQGKDSPDNIGQSLLLC